MNGLLSEMNLISLCCVCQKIENPINLVCSPMMQLEPQRYFRTGNSADGY